MSQNNEIENRFNATGEKQKEEHEERGGRGELELYGYENIASKDARVPRWLILTYILLPLWGFCSLYYYFNGSQGWLDRGYWNQLQRAALTTYPYGTIQEEAEERTE